MSDDAFAKALATVPRGRGKGTRALFTPEQWQQVFAAHAEGATWTSIYKALSEVGQMPYKNLSSFEQAVWVQRQKNGKP